MNAKSLVESELGHAIAALGMQFHVRAANEGDLRAESFSVELARLRLRWMAGAWACEPIESNGKGDRR